MDCDLEIVNLISAGGFGIGGFNIGYKFEVTNTLKKLRQILSNPYLYHYRNSTEKINECIIFLYRYKQALLEHNTLSNLNCNENEKLECIEIIDSFLSEIRMMANPHEPNPLTNKKVNKQKSELPNPDHFKTQFSTEKLLSQLYYLLANDNFIDNNFTTLESFMWIFGYGEKPQNFTPIMWIKSNSKTNGTRLNKRSILNLLLILKVPEKQIINRHLLNCTFVKPDGSSIKFTSSNYSKGYISEYNKTLQDFVERGK